jgi:cytochrome c oxidase subunit 2
MSIHKTGIGAGLAALAAMWTSAAFAVPYDYEMGLQPAASPVMEQIESFHQLLLYITVAICLLVLALLVFIVARYNHKASPTPSRTEHNTLLEIAWTVIPVVILVVIAVPSFKLLYYEADIPKADVELKVIGKQWFWTYQYPRVGNFQFDSLGLSDDAAKKANEPRLLGVDNAIVVPVNKVIEVVTTGADVIHSWALPEMGVKMDAIPGHLNYTWFRATRTGTFYGECSELCGAKHAFMPIEVKVVTDSEYAKWLAMAKKKYAAIDDGSPTRLAAQ